MLACVFEIFRNICLIIYELDPAEYLSAPGLTRQPALKMIKAKLDLLPDIDMILMVEKGIRRNICHFIYWYAKANNKYMNNYDKNKELSHLHYYNVNNLYGWAILQKPPVNYFELIKDTSQFNENLIKIYNEESDEENFLEIDNQYLQKLQKHYNGLPFLLKRMKIEKNREVCS